MVRRGIVTSYALLPASTLWNTNTLRHVNKETLPARWTGVISRCHAFVVKHTIVGRYASLLTGSGRRL